MSFHDLDEGLSVIAEHGHRTGRLETASELRARGDRRRHRRYTAAAAFGVVIAGALGVGISVARQNADSPMPPLASQARQNHGIQLGQPSVAPSVTPSSVPSIAASTPKTPSSRPSTSASRSVSSSGVLSGDRQVSLYPLHRGDIVPDSAAAVTTSGRLDVTQDFGDRSLLVPVPKSVGSKQFLIKTGKLRTGGEALCMQVQSNGSDPLTLVTKGCNAAQKDQLFKFDENGRDNQDRTTYLISVDGQYMRYSPDEKPATGLIVQETGEGDDLTSFVIIDRGQATLPQD